MKFLITIFQDEDGMFIAECPSITGCISQGKTEQDAEQNIQEAIKECLQVRSEQGMPLLRAKFSLVDSTPCWEPLVDTPVIPNPLLLPPFCFCLPSPC